MLYRIAKGEKIAPGFFQAIAQSDQFFPAVDGDEPVVSQITGEFLRVLEPEIGDIAIRPDKRMKRFNIQRRASVFFSTVDAHSPRFAQLNRDDARRFVRAEKKLVIFESHNEIFLDFARNDK